MNVPVLGRRSSTRGALEGAERRTPSARVRCPAQPDAGSVSRDTLPSSRTAPASRAFHVETRHDAHRAVAAPVGEFDAAALSVFGEAITELVESQWPVEIDLSRVTFIDSAGLWAITVAQRMCRKRGLDLLIKPGPELVHGVFEVTGLADLLPFAHVDTAEALPAEET